MSASRQAVVAEALNWCGTPWHHAAAIKGVGVDCAQLPRAIFNAFGAEIRENDRYPRDWHLHRSEERFLQFMLEYCVEIEEEKLLPADLILWRIGRCFSHAGIYIGDGKVVHAIASERTTRVSGVDEGRLAVRVNGRGDVMRRYFRWTGFADV